jgi:hypothetical protein
MAAAPRAVRKQYDTAGVVDNMDLAFEQRRARGNSRVERVSRTGL